MASKLDIIVAGARQSAMPTEPLLAAVSHPWPGVFLEEHVLPPLEMPDHSVPYYLIALNVSTQPVTRFWYESGREHSRLLGNGDVGVMSPGELRRFRWDRPATMIAVRIDPEFIDTFVGDELHGRQLLLRPEKGRHDPEIRDLIYRLRADALSGSPQGTLMGEELCTRLALEMCRKYSIEKFQISEYSGGLAKCTLRRVLDYIDANLNGDLKMSELAGVAALSRYHFGKAFKTSTGTTVHQYVLSLRIDRARRLLRSGDLSIEQTGTAYGFSSQSHFTSVFSQRLGISPALYRRLSVVRGLRPPALSIT